MKETSRNLYTYLEQASSVSSSQVPLNEADDLVFAVLSYLDLSDVIPPAGKPPVSVREVSEAYFREHPVPQTVEDDGTSSADALQMVLNQMANAERYRDMELSDYVVISEPEHLREFCAFCIHDGDEDLHVVFRGTSDSLTGWQESFHMACPGHSRSQEDAAEYLGKVGEEFPQAVISVCGHSKGGNHAVYAAASVVGSIRERIRCVRVFDGIGFSRDFLASSGYQSIRERIRYYIPPASVIGTLLPAYRKMSDSVVVNSTAEGFMQHDLKTWQISGSEFEKLPKLNVQTIRAVRRIRAWIARIPEQEREPFTDALFQVIYATGITKFPELSKIKMREWMAALGQFLSLNKIDRKRIREFVSLLRITVNQVSACCE